MKDQSRNDWDEGGVVVRLCLVTSFFLSPGFVVCEAPPSNPDLSSSGTSVSWVWYPGSRSLLTSVRDNGYEKFGVGISRWVRLWGVKFNPRIMVNVRSDGDPRTDAVGDWDPWHEGYTRVFPSWSGNPEGVGDRSQDVPEGGGPTQGEGTPGSPFTTRLSS